MRHPPTVVSLPAQFGVFDGATIRLMARHRGHAANRTDSAWEPPPPIWGFDSFRGLPEAWRSWHGRPGGDKYVRKGAFDRGGKPPFEESRAIRWVVGPFNESLPSFLREHREPIEVVHIDCDLYSSTMTVLEQLSSRLRPGERRRPFRDANQQLLTPLGPHLSQVPCSSSTS